LSQTLPITLVAADIISYPRFELFGENAHLLLASSLLLFVSDFYFLFQIFFLKKIR